MGTESPSRRRLDVLSLLLVLAGLFCAARAEQDIAQLPVYVRRALFEAQELRNAHEYDRAVGVLQKCLREHPEPDYAVLHFYLANNLALAGESRAALTEYQNTTRLDPHHAPAWLNLAEIAYGDGQYVVAGEAFERGFAETSPARPEILYYAAVAYFTGEQAGRALPILEDLVSGAHGPPQLDWFRAFLAAALELGRAADFTGVADEMVRVHAAEPEAWRLASSFAAGAGDYRGAALALTIAGYLAPLSRVEQLQLASLYQAIGTPAVAGSHFAAALADSGSADEYAQLVSLHLSAHDEQRAWQVLEDALAKEETPRLWSMAGDLHYAERRYAEAYAAFARAVELGESGGRVHLMLGFCAFELERWSAAKRHLQQAARFPDQAASAGALLQRIP